MVLLVVVAAALALAGGVALAESKTCATLDCVGTPEADTNDSGALDADTIHVNEFNEVSAGDTVNCGSGTKDRVFFDQGFDTIHENCEIRKSV